MALTTLTATKLHLGISGSAEDSALAAWIRSASAIVRSETGRYWCGVIQANTAAAATVITCYGHGLATGDTISISGSNCTPTIDGARTITRTGTDTFTVPVTVTVAGTAGIFAVTRTEYYAGRGTPFLALNQTPVQSVASIYEDSGAYYGEASGAFGASTLLTAGTDYCLSRDNASSAAVSTSGIILRIGASWPAASQKLSGLLSKAAMPGLGNIKVTYTAGLEFMEPDLELAVMQVAASLRQSASSGGALQSESLDYYSYSRASGSEQSRMLGSAVSLLKRFKRVAV